MNLSVRDALCVALSRPQVDFAGFDRGLVAQVTRIVFVRTRCPQAGAALRPCMRLRTPLSTLQTPTGRFGPQSQGPVGSPHQRTKHKQINSPPRLMIHRGRICTSQHNAKQSKPKSRHVKSFDEANDNDDNTTNNFELRTNNDDERRTNERTNDERRRRFRTSIFPPSTTSYNLCTARARALISVNYSG